MKLDFVFLGDGAKDKGMDFQLPTGSLIRSTMKAR